MMIEKIEYTFTMYIILLLVIPYKYLYFYNKYFKNYYVKRDGKKK